MARSWLSTKQRPITSLVSRIWSTRCRDSYRCAQVCARKGAVILLHGLGTYLTHMHTCTCLADTGLCAHVHLRRCTHIHTLLCQHHLGTTAQPVLGRYIQNPHPTLSAPASRPWREKPLLHVLPGRPQHSEASTQNSCLLDPAIRDNPQRAQLGPASTPSQVPSPHLQRAPFPLHSPSIAYS